MREIYEAIFSGFKKTKKVQLLKNTIETIKLIENFHNSK